MGKSFTLVVLFVFLTISMCACTDHSNENSQLDSKDVELYAVSDDISLKTGTSFDGEIVLESEDFMGFWYEYDDSNQEYIFTFKMTDEGRQKMTAITTELAETSGDLSMWVGNELIVSSRLMTPITGDEFAINMVDVNKDNIASFVDQLQEK